MSEPERQTTPSKLVRRWFHVTPDRFVVGLLLMQCLLWLSERFQWFRFNTYMGWTVLIDASVVGVAMLVMLLSFVVALVFRLRFQFSIRLLFLLTVSVAFACSWFAVENERARKQAEAVGAIYSVGGRVAWNPQLVAWGPRPSEPAWLRGLLGDEFFRFEGLLALGWMELLS
jgi:hypothetical protein